MMARNRPGAQGEALGKSTGRKRPGRREREAMARARFADYRSEVVALNLAAMGPRIAPIPCGPRGYGKSSANPDKLREGTSTAGFGRPAGHGKAKGQGPATFKPWSTR